MLNLLDRIYSSIKNKSIILTKLKIYSLFRFIVRLFANIILPFYFYITQRNKNYSLESSKKNEGQIIVSLTSFPARINRLWLVIETLLRQTRKPDKIILWLSIEQFPCLQSLPKNLLSLQNRGLEIRICVDNLRSHKKYFYAIKEFPNDIIITFDDDVFYNTKVIEYLLNLNSKFPNCVCCNNSSEIIQLNNKIEPYTLWNSNSIAECPSFKIFPIGLGGILYPPKVLHPIVLNSKIFLEICFLADDIWLNVMTKLANNMAVKSKYNSSYLPVMNFKNTTLASLNISDGMNDKQLKALQEYCIINIGLDPFEKIND